jgi:hypothetical protein
VNPDPRQAQQEKAPVLRIESRNTVPFQQMDRMFE